MEVTKVELKILIKEFLTASNRVLRAGYEIYADELEKFIKFLKEKKLIYDYIMSCGEPEYDAEQAVRDLCNSYGKSIFALGSTDKNEVANIFSVIQYLAEHNYGGRSDVYYGYSNSKKFQDKVNAFGDKFVRILIIHIENYLTKVSIQMGLDEKMTVNVKIENSNLSNSQVNVASDSSSIVTNQTACDIDQLQKLLNNLLLAAERLNPDERQTVDECVEVIETIKEDKPKKGIVKMAVNTLKGIAGTAEFVAAVAAIVQFVGQYI